MDAISLPLVFPDTTPLQALRQMRAARKSAAVVSEPDETFSLVSASVVALGLHHGLQSIEATKRIVVANNVMNRERVLAPEPVLLAEHDVSLTNPPSTAEQYEAMLNQANFGYGLLAATTTDAIIVTRSEQFAQQIGSGPVDCYGDPCGHPNPNRLPGQDCELCAEPEVVCVTY